MGNNPYPFYYNYETMRKFVSRFTIYGCFKDILGSSTHEGSTNQETTKLKNKKRLKRQLGDSLKTDKCFHVENDRYTSNLHILKDTYKERKASITELVLYCIILYLFSKNKTVSRKKLFDMLTDLGFYNESIYAVLDTLTEDSILIKDNGCYSLTDDIFEGMDSDDFFSLYCAAEFFTMKSPFAVSGLFLQDTINMYTQDKLSAPIICQHHFPHHIANDNQAHIILDAILNKRKITIGGNGRIPVNVTPIKLMYNFQTGVQKVLVAENGKAWIEYIDDIYVKNCTEEAELSEASDIEQNTSDGEQQYIEAEFKNCIGYRRLFPKNIMPRKNVLMINYSSERTSCLRFTGHIKLSDKDTAEEYVNTLTEMSRLNKAQKFDTPQKFEFNDDTGGKKEFSSDVSFEIISKNRLIELAFSGEENDKYDELTDELLCSLKYKGITGAEIAKLPVRTTALEREFIGMMLTDKQTCTLLSDNCLRLLRERVPEIKWQHAFEAEYTYREKNPSRENMQFILDAIKGHKRFGYTNTTFHGIINASAVPYKLLYSQRRRKLQLIALARADGENKDRLVLLDVHSLSNLRLVPDSGEKHSEETEREIMSRRKSVRLLVNGTDKHSFRKAFMLMSHYDRRSYYNKKTNVYEMNVYYYTFDEYELVQDILSLGTAVIVCCKDENKKPSDIYRLVLEKIDEGIRLNK